MWEFFVFMFIIGLIINAYPVIILIILGIGAVIGIIAIATAISDARHHTKKGGSGGVGSYGGYSSPRSTTTTSSGSTSPTPSDDLGSSSSYNYFYKGSMASGFVTGSYNNSQIFKGLENESTGFAFVKASYTGGYIYEGTMTGMFGKVIGRYEYGRLYRGNSTRHDDMVATYKNGYIYRGHSSYDVIGRYDGDDDGGAATAFYFLFYDNYD